ncbi:MAG: hypothetical protein Q9162_000598 [Coniocarpon cinnabarinum]
MLSTNPLVTRLPLANGFAPNSLAKKAAELVQFISTAGTSLQELCAAWVLIVDGIKFSGNPRGYRYFKTASKEEGRARPKASYIRIAGELIAADDDAGLQVNNPRAQAFGMNSENTQRVFNMVQGQATRGVLDLPYCSRDELALKMGTDANTAIGRIKNVCKKVHTKSTEIKLVVLLGIRLQKATKQLAEVLMQGVDPDTIPSLREAESTSQAPAQDDGENTAESSGQALAGAQAQTQAGGGVQDAPETQPAKRGTKRKTDKAASGERPQKRSRKTNNTGARSQQTNEAVPMPGMADLPSSDARHIRGDSPILTSQASGVMYPQLLSMPNNGHQAIGAGLQPDVVDPRVLSMSSTQDLNGTSVHSSVVDPQLLSLPNTQGSNNAGVDSGVIDPRLLSLSNDGQQANTNGLQSFNNSQDPMMSGNVSSATYSNANAVWNNNSQPWNMDGDNNDLNTLVPMDGFGASQLYGWGSQFYSPVGVVVGDQSSQEQQAAAAVLEEEFLDFEGGQGSATPPAAQTALTVVPGQALGRRSGAGLGNPPSPARGERASSEPIDGKQRQHLSIVRQPLDQLRDFVPPPDSQAIQQMAANTGATEPFAISDVRFDGLATYQFFGHPNGIVEMRTQYTHGTPVYISYGMTPEAAIYNLTQDIERMRRERAQ